MKNLKRIKPFMLQFTGLAVALTLTFACNENRTEDSKEVAEEMNEENLGNESNNPVGIVESNNEGQFLVDAAEIHMEEVSLGKLAQMQGDNPTVKDLGKKMENEHSKALTELKALASAKNITIPATETQDSRKTIDDIRDETGVEFGKDYSENSVKNHKDAIKLFEKAAEDSEDPEIRSYAAQTLASLRTNLQLAEACKEECERMAKSGQ
jgi:putative membrane protein